MRKDAARVVITGLGVVAPPGFGHRAFWEALLTKQSFVRSITRFDVSSYRCQIGGEILNFRPEQFLEPKVVKQTDWSTQMGMVACDLAVEDAHLELRETDTRRIGMYFANIFGGMQFAEPELFAQTCLSPNQVSAYQAIAWFYAATQGQWSIARGVKGHAKTIVGDRAGGLQAIILGAQLIRQGHCDMVLSGGFEAPFAPYVYAIHEASGDLAESQDSSVYRPLDPRAGGMVLAEGAGILLLESLESAQSRHAPIYAELAGCAMNMSTLREERENSPLGLAHCITLALADAGTQARDVDIVLPSGCGVPYFDHREARALERVFGDEASRPTALVPKAAFGHTLAAAGALDAILAARIVSEGVTPTAWMPEQPLEPLRLYTASGDVATRRPDTVLCVGQGCQGLNAAVALRQLERLQ
jgi:3-oxoacyl-(acyl-carrier-protein) synthase